jgi:predicted aminopeptidase
VIDDPSTSPDLADLLKKIPEIKAYGEKSGLKPTKNYRDYVKLDQDAVVYVVTVSDALEFKAKIFSFPIVGSFNYIGWFGLDDAKKFASTFEKEGYDVDVRGATAYSTLGWFRDPLLSTMIPKENGKIAPEAYAELVNVFLHESVHATVYINNQSTFNEGLAVFVADQLTERFFKDHHEEKSTGYLEYRASLENWEKTRAGLTHLYEDLKALYASSAAPAEKLAQKNTKIEAFQKEFGFKRKITNATLIQFETYHSSHDDFQWLFEKTGNDIQELMRVMATLKESDFTEPQEENLKALMEKLAQRISIH